MTFLFTEIVSLSEPCKAINHPMSVIEASLIISYLTVYVKQLAPHYIVKSFYVIFSTIFPKIFVYKPQIIVYNIYNKL